MANKKILALLTIAMLIGTTLSLFAFVGSTRQENRPPQLSDGYGPNDLEWGKEDFDQQSPCVYPRYGVVDDPNTPEEDPTAFKFRVFYHDEDHNPEGERPTVYVNITELWNGTYTTTRYNLTQEDPTQHPTGNDDHYSAVITANLFNGNYSGVKHWYYFVGSDGKDKTRWPDEANYPRGYEGPDVYKASPSKPHLDTEREQPVVTPFGGTVGTNDTEFTFKVRYMDLDDDPAKYVKLSIEGQLDKAMVDTGIGDYRTGRLFEYRMVPDNFDPPLMPGNYKFRFRASDGWWIVNSSEFNFTIERTNEKPQLLNGKVFPKKGENTDTTIFRYEITYLDLNGDEPQYMNIQINSTNTTGNFSMSKLYNVSNYKDGVVYIYNMSGKQLGIGIHSYQFLAYDGRGNEALGIEYGYNNTTVFTGPEVVAYNKPPELINGAVSQTTGDTETIFNYTVIYKDEDNPVSDAIVKVIIKGGTTRNETMLEVNISDTNVADGKEYYFNTNLSVGSYTFYFYGSDGSKWVQTQLFTGPTVNPKNTPPVITSSTPTEDSVYINEGSKQWFSITATDYENDILSYEWTLGTQIVGTGTSYVFDYITIYGKQYLPDHNQRIYYIKVNISDGKETVWRNWTLTVNDTNRPPTAVISSPIDKQEFNVNQEIEFNAVNSSDYENDNLSYTWIADGQILRNNTTTVVFKQKLGTGNYTIKLFVYDGYGGSDSTSVNIRVKPPPNIPPELLNGTISQTSGKEGDEFTFTVVYKDANKNIPKYVKVIIARIDENGTIIETTPHSMVKTSGDDYSLGVTYVNTTPIHTSGNYKYWFEADDNNGSKVDTKNQAGEFVVEKKPIDEFPFSNILFPIIGLAILIVAIGGVVYLWSKKKGSVKEEEEEVEKEEE